MKYILVIVIALSLVWIASDAYAQTKSVDLTADKIIDLFTDLVCWFARIASTIMMGAIIFYGILFMNAKGDPTKVTDAKKAMLWALVGLMVILGSYTIIATVANAVGAGASYTPLSC